MFASAGENIVDYLKATPQHQVQQMQGKGGEGGRGGGGGGGG
jgi:hypothetical protein